MATIRSRMGTRVRALLVIGDSSNPQQSMTFLKNLEWTLSNLRKGISSLYLGSVDGNQQLSQIKIFGQTVGRLVLYC